jgi:uncharacterized protein (UPF0261 family)
MKKTIVLVGRLDSKGDEYSFVKDRILKGDFDLVVVDVGTRGTPRLKPDISREEVAKATGVEMRDVVDRSDENKEIQTMMQGAAVISKRLFDAGKLDGIMALGGSRGTAIGTSAMRALPFGIPKVMVSSIASGDMRPYVATKDIMVVHSVTDILGLNRMTRPLLANAAAAIMGAVARGGVTEASGKMLIALSSMGGVNRLVFGVQKALEAGGYEIVAFHAVGTGGRALEETVGQGLVNAVLDLVTHEVTDHVLGGYYDAGETRLETAGARGIPQVVVPGCTDFIAFSPPDKVPEHMRGRKVFMHTPEVAIIRVNKAEMESVGRAMALKLNKAIGPAAVIIPMKGFSPGNREGRALYDPEADRAFVEALKRDIKPSVRVIEVNAHINDDVFAQRAVQLLEELIRGRSS